MPPIKRTVGRPKGTGEQLTEKVDTRITKEEREALDRLAEAEEKSRAEVMREAIRDYIAKRPSAELRGPERDDSTNMGHSY